jgi:exodeoxyribonuclease VII small subunit
MPEDAGNGQGPRPVEELTFEQAYAELEQTAQALQQGQLSLDETLHLYERGSLLSRYCLEKLEGVEFKVTQLLSRADGTHALKTLASERDVTPPEPQPADPPPPAASQDAEDQALKEQKELFD